VEKLLNDRGFPAKFRVWTADGEPFGLAAYVRRRAVMEATDSHDGKNFWKYPA